MSCSRRDLRAIWLMLAVVGLALVVIGAALRQHSPTWKDYQGSPQIRAIVPGLTRQKELCLTCHFGIEEISPSHPVDVFGCVSCHGGVGTALDADLAHSEMVRNPGDLSYAEPSCGGSECHSGPAEQGRDHIPRVERSIQATYAGAITSIRRSFGLQPDGTAHMGMQAAQSYPGVPDNGGRPTVAAIEMFQAAPADPPLVYQFAANCLACHLQGTPIQQPTFYRATGCSACHVLYDDDGLYKGSDPTIPKNKLGHMARHQLTTAIPYTQCNHCHNRGNYELPTMTFVHRGDLPLPDTLTSTERRARDYYQPIAQFTRCEWELDCADCHTRREVMGDGYLYSNQKEARYLQCKTCHGTLDAPPLTTTVTDPNDIALRLAFLNPYVALAIGETIVVTELGEPLPHIIQRDGQFLLTMKATGQQMEVPLVMGSACQQRPDQQESQYCHECHTYQPTDQP